MPDGGRHTRHTGSVRMVGRPGRNAAELRESQKRGFQMTMTSARPRAGGRPGVHRQMINAIIASLLGWSLDLFDLLRCRGDRPVSLHPAYLGPNATLSLAAVYA